MDTHHKALLPVRQGRGAIVSERTKLGTFSGTVQTRWVPDHPRNMRLLETVRFIDRRGKTWLAEPSTIINGASTGWFFRRLFPAYVGFYRRTSVLHDYYCTKKSRPSWAVHRMFREAMITDIYNMAKPNRCPRWMWWLVCKARVAQAWIMWVPVRMFGPRF